MHPLVGRRVTGYLLDCVGYLAIPAALVPAGIAVVRLTDLGRSRSYPLLVSSIPPIVAAVIAARAEAGPHRATWGKRRMGLQVERMPAASGGAPPTEVDRTRTDRTEVDRTEVDWTRADGGRPLSLGRALIRSTIKIAVPWQAGHMTTISAIRGDFEDGDLLARGAAVVTYAMIGAMAVTCLRGSGRGPHDLLAGSRVVEIRNEIRKEDRDQVPEIRSGSGATPRRPR